MNTRFAETSELEKVRLNGSARKERTVVIRKPNSPKERNSGWRFRKLIRASQWRDVNQIIVTLAAGFLPIASYVVAHIEAAGDRWLWILVGACLLFSAPTLATWSLTWTGNGWLGRIKAWGFTIVLEGTMIFSHTELLRLSGMVLLVVINAAYAFKQAKAKPRESVADAQ